MGTWGAAHTFLGGNHHKPIPRVWADKQLNDAFGCTGGVTAARSLKDIEQEGAVVESDKERKHNVMQRDSETEMHRERERCRRAPV